MLNIEPWRVCMPLVADSHHFGDEQYLDSRIRIKVKSRIRMTGKGSHPDRIQSKKSYTDPLQR